MRRLINISEQVQETYKKYFFRNCEKWISRNNISEENLDKEFTVDDEIFILKGQITDRDFFMQKKSTGEFYTVDGKSFISQTQKKQSGKDKV